MRMVRIVQATARKLQSDTLAQRALLRYRTRAAEHARLPRALADSRNSTRSSPQVQHDQQVALYCATQAGQ
jgi:DNA-nicking Smr family endonuclease